MRYIKLISLLIFIVGLLFTFTVSAADIPPANGTRVIDTSNTLSQNEQLSINARLADYEKTSTNQILVLMIPTLNGEDIEGYANRAFRTYQLGQKDKNNGILFVIAKNDRKMRVEVGYSLEGILNDGLAGQILREQVQPAFKQSQFANGINNALNAIIGTLSRGSQPATVSNVQPLISSPTRPVQQEDNTWIFNILIGIAGIAALASLGAGLYSFFSRKKKDSDIVVTNIKASSSATYNPPKPREDPKPLLMKAFNDARRKDLDDYGSTFKQDTVDYKPPTTSYGKLEVKPAPKIESRSSYTPTPTNEDKAVISKPYESSRSSSRSSCSSYSSCSSSSYSSSSSYDSSSSSSSSSSDSFSGGGGDSGGGGCSSDW